MIESGSFEIGSQRQCKKKLALPVMPILLKSTRRLRNYFMMTNIVFILEGSLQRSTNVCASMFFFWSTHNMCRYLKQTIYRFRVVEKGSTAGGANSMSSNIVLFSEKSLRKT